MRNLFKLKNWLNYTVIYKIRNLFRQENETKAIKHGILTDIKFFFEHEEEV